MPFFYFDYWYLILVLPAVLVSLWAQIRVKSTFAKYSRQSVRSGMTGARASQYIQQGFDMVLNVFASISLNLGIMNLLPLPALDGGRLVFLAIEGIFRKPVPRDKEGMVHAVGMILLFGLMIVLTYSDIMKMIGG